REQAGTQGLDLGTVGRPHGGDQEAVLYRLAAVARMAPRAALDDHIDLALEQLVQSRRLADAYRKLRLRPSELGPPRPQAIDVDAAMHSDVQQARNALGPELGGRFGDAVKRLAHR